MSKEIKIPELRFPEFVKDGDWKENTLSQVAGYENGKAHEKDIAEDGQYIVVNSKFISSEGETVKYSDKAFCLARKGDTLMVLSDVPNGKAIAKCFYVNENNRYTVNQRVCKMTPFDCQNHLLYYIMDRNQYFLTFDDGVKQTNLRKDDVQGFSFLLPKSPKEQQKIASCLSSLDELIAAHSDKLEALKNHKKGLMQNLFPQKGQKVPNYRFPEFLDDGEWREKVLGNFINERIEISNGDAPLYSLTIEDGIIPKSERYERSFLVKDLKEAYKLVYPNDFAYNPMNLRFGAIAQFKGKITVVLSKYYNIFYCDESVDSGFCEIYFKSYQMLTIYDDIATGSLIEKRRVHFSEFLKLEIPFPKKAEQQKIASCLSSLDELITEQLEKIEQLQQHKKGLMQGLFPKINR